MERSAEGKGGEEEGIPELRHHLRCEQNSAAGLNEIELKAINGAQIVKRGQSSYHKPNQRDQIC
jgi:hypothetical protein